MCSVLKPRAAEPWLQEASEAAGSSTLAWGSSGFGVHTRHLPTVSKRRVQVGAPAPHSRGANGSRQA